MADVINIAEQITCVRREIAMREAVYPKRVAGGKMKQEMADRELARMRAVLATLVSLEALYEDAFSEHRAGAARRC